MTTLKKKELYNPVVDTEIAEIPVITEEEKDVLSEDGDKHIAESSKVSSAKMTAVLDLLQDKFNLKDKGFELIGYADKGNKIVATLANSDYEIQFTIKSSDILMYLEVNKGSY